MNKRLIPGLLSIAAAIAVLGAFPLRAASASCPNTFTDSCRCPAGCTVSDSCERVCVLLACLETGGSYRCTLCSCDTVIGHCPSFIERAAGAVLSTFASVANAAEPSQGTRKDFSNEHGDFVVLDRKAMDRIGAASAGVGLTLAVGKDRVTVTGAVEKGPAATAGLAAGDELISINGRKVTGKTAPQISAELRGRDGTLVVLRIKSKKSGKTANVSMIRSEEALTDAARSGVGGDVTIKSFELSALDVSDCPKEKGDCRFLYREGGVCRYTCPSKDK